MSDQYTNPKSWGPHFWFILRCIANNYSDNPTKEETAHVRTFIMELQYVLPCEVCKYTFRQHYNRNPLDRYLGNKDKLMEWVELIYQETKKVIQDKRIKIIDSFEEEPSVALPMRTVYKSKHFDPLSVRLEEIRKKATEQKKSDVNIQNEAKNIVEAAKPVLQMPKLEPPKPVIQMPVPVPEPTQEEDPMLKYIVHYDPKPILRPILQPPKQEVKQVIKQEVKPIIKQEMKPVIREKYNLETISEQDSEQEEIYQDNKPEQISKPVIQIQRMVPQPKVEIVKKEIPKQEKPKLERIKKDHKIDVSSSESKVPYVVPQKLANVNNKPVNIDVPKNTVVKKDKKHDVTAHSLPEIKKDKAIVSKPHIKQYMPKTHIASKIHAPSLVVTKRCRKCDEKAAN